MSVPNLGPNVPKTGSLENYAEHTTRLYKVQSDLGWALRDRKWEEAHRLLAEIMACSAALHRFVETKRTVSA